MAEEITYYLSNLSCPAIWDLPSEERCDLGRKIPSCTAIINYINYFEIMNCWHKEENDPFINVIKVLFIMSIGLLVLMIGVITKVYLQPMTMLISIKLNMNEYLAGITLIAFVNSFPDLIGSMLEVRAKSAIFTKTLSNCVVDILLCGGLVCFLKPFKMDGYSVVRDMLFLVLAVELNTTIIEHSNRVTSTECLMLIIVYFIYLAIQVADLVLMRYSMKALQRQIQKLENQPYSAERNKKLKSKLSLFIHLQHHEELHIHNDTIKTTDWIKNVEPHILDKMTPKDVKVYMTRYCLHNKKNSRNVYLISDFFHGINPIDAMEWKLGGWLARSIIILQIPLFFTIKIMIPNIDRDLNKHGWIKLLNCIQIVTCPFFIITSIHSLLAKNYTGWLIDIDISVSIWTLILTVPLAVYVFCTTRTDIPPKYHALYLLMSLPAAFTIIFMCTVEMEILCEVLGGSFQLRGEYMDVSVFSILNSLMDSVVLVGMTMRGYEKMAFAAVLAGPFFTLVVNMAVPMYFNERTREVGADIWLFGEHGDTCYLFFMMTALTTLLWTSTFNFASRRSGGIFSWLLLFLFFLFSFLIEFNFVHSFSADVHIDIT